MIFTLFVCALLGIVGYLGYQQYQKYLLNNGYTNVSPRYRRNETSTFSNSFSNRKTVPIHDSRLQDKRTSRDSNSFQHYYPSPNNQFIRNRNSIATTSPVSFISPNSVYGVMPKSSISNGRDKHREITREFTVKISPFPNLNRNATLHKNVSFEQKQNQSMEMGNRSNYSGLNGSIQQINETPTHASSFNRSSKRPISNDDDEFLSKKYKNNLFDDTIEVDDSENSDETYLDDKISSKKAQKRPTQSFECDFNSQKRIKNNEILSSFSSTTDYLSKNSFSKRKHSPEGPVAFGKTKKRTFIEELELLASDTSPYYRNIYNPNANTKSNAGKNNSIIIDNDSLASVEEESVDLNLAADEDLNQFGDDALDENNGGEKEAENESSALIVDKNVVNNEESENNDDDDEERNRCYPIPVHVYSTKDYEYDKKKTKNRLDRFMAAVEESSQNASIKTFAEQKATKDSTDSMLSNVKEILKSDLPVVSTIAPTITTTITLADNGVQSGLMAVKSTAANNAFILPVTFTTASTTPSANSQSMGSSIQSISAPSFSPPMPITSVQSSNVANEIKSSSMPVLPKYEQATSTIFKAPQNVTTTTAAKASDGIVKFNIPSFTPNTTISIAGTSSSTQSDLAKAFSFGTDKMASIPQSSVQSTASFTVPASSVAPTSTATISLPQSINFNNAPKLAFNFQSSTDDIKKDIATNSNNNVITSTPSTFNFGMNPSSSSSTTTTQLPSIGSTFNMATTAPVSSSSVIQPNQTFTSNTTLNNAPNNIFALNNNNNNNTGGNTGSSLFPSSNQQLQPSKSSANLFSFGPTSVAAPAAAPVASSVSQPSFNFSQINSASLTNNNNLIAASSSIPTFQSTMSQNQPQQQAPQLFSFNTPNTNNNTTFNTSNNLGTVNPPSFNFNATQSTLVPPSSISNNMFSFNSPSTKVEPQQSKPTGFTFNANPISFDFKPKASVVPVATGGGGGNSGSSGFNFSAAVSQPLSQTSNNASSGFNFAAAASVPPSNLTAPQQSSATPFTFNSNPPAISFGSSSNSNQASTGMFQFNSK